MAIIAAGTGTGKPFSMIKYILFTLPVLAGFSAGAQKIRYDVSFPNAAHHEALITLTATDIPKTAATFRMSRSSPGRYATHEFGKNVYDVKAADLTGKPLPVNRVEGDVYEVPQQNGAVKLTYTLYANYPDGTYAGIDVNSIHLNMPAVFMWLKGMDQAPIEVSFHLPAGNAGRVATQLIPTTDPLTFTAPGLQYFMDSPTKIGDLLFNEWDVANADGRNVHFRIAYEITANRDQAEVFTGKIKRLVQEEKAVFGEFPAYDQQTYTFLASINPYVNGDGMEHRNSTMITIPAPFTGQNNIGVFAHEFFHCWNVERIRPKTLEPFNFEKSNMSNELWLAEGFTQYYGQLLPVRAGIENPDSYVNAIAGAVNTKLNTVGATAYSPVDASRNAVFVDAGVSIDRTNYSNMFTSYYTYGAAIAMTLDLELRSRFDLTLDQYMQALWKTFGKPEVPYTLSLLEEQLARITNKTYASEFFRKYIYGHEPVDFRNLLAQAGMQVVTPNVNQAWMGNTGFEEGQNGLAIAANTVKGTPLYEAGLDVGDMIEQMDEKPVKTREQIMAVINAHKPGDKISLLYRHRNEQRTGSVTFAGNPGYAVVPYEKAGLPVTAAIRKFRESWTGSKVAGK